MTWQPGRDKISDLLSAAELQQVAADHRVAQLLLDDAGRHLATAAAAASSGDLSGAYLLAYDALRKSAASRSSLPAATPSAVPNHGAALPLARRLRHHRGSSPQG